MRKWALLLLLVALALLPLLEFFDTWERPWSTNSGELVFTLLFCAVAVGYAFVRLLLPFLSYVLNDCSTPGLGLSHSLARQEVLRKTAMPSSLSGTPLRI